MKLCKTERAFRATWTKSARRLAFAAAIAGLTSSSVQAQSAGPVGPQAPVTTAPTLELGAPVRPATAARKISDQPSSQLPVPMALPKHSAVRLASGEAVSNDSVPTNEVSESLLDLDIPVPGLDLHLKVPSAPATTTDVPSASDRSPIAREPEIVPRGRKMKIRIEPVRLDEQTGEAIRLPTISHLSDSSMETSMAPAIELSTRAPEKQGIVGGAIELALPTDTANQPVAVELATDSSSEKPVATLANQDNSSAMSLSDSVDYVDQSTPMMDASITMSDSNSPDLVATEQVVEPMSSTPPSPTFSIDDIETGPSMMAEQPVLPSQPISPSQSIAQTMPAATPPAAIARPMPSATATTVPENKAAVADLSTTPMHVGDAMVLTAQGVAALDASGPIIEYSVEHPTICRLVRTSDTTLSLVGLKEGSTRVAVVTASAEGEPQSIEVRTVSVRGIAAEASKQQHMHQELSQAIAKLYPRSNIRVQQRGEEIVVMGYAQTEKSARRIVSMVRKTTLSPVVDEVRSATR